MHRDIVSASHTILPWGISVPPLFLSPLSSNSHGLITEQKREEVRTKWEKRAKARMYIYNMREEALSMLLEEVKLVHENSCEKLML